MAPRLPSKPIARREGETPRAWCLRLGWKLLEYKCAYYRPDEIKEELWAERGLYITDEEYDALEREFAALTKQLNEIDQITTMVDFDVRRPACQWILTKLKGDT